MKNFIITSRMVLSLQSRHKYVIEMAMFEILLKNLFFIFIYLFIFLLFFAEFELLMFHNNIVKLSERVNRQNLLKICQKICQKFTYLTDLCIICIHFYCGEKRENI